MANTLPLNKFVLVTQTIGDNPDYNNLNEQLIYSSSLDVSTIVLSLQLTNHSDVSGSIVNIKLQRSGSAAFSYLTKNSFIPLYETYNPLAGKLVLEKEDAIWVEGVSPYVSASVDIVGSFLQNANN